MILRIWFGYNRPLPPDRVIVNRRERERERLPCGYAEGISVRFDTIHGVGEAFGKVRGLEEDDADEGREELVELCCVMKPNTIEYGVIVLL